MATVAEQLVAAITTDLTGLEAGVAQAKSRLAELQADTVKTSAGSETAFASAWERGTARASASLQRFTGALQQASERAEMLSASTGRIGIELSAGLTAPVAELLKMGIGFDDVKQRATLAFTNMLGSAKAAKQEIADLQKFDLQTPLDFGDTLKGAQQLKQMGTAAKDIVPSLKAVTDNLSNSAEGITAFPRIIHALGEMQATSRLTGGEMLMLARDGVPAYQYLSEAMGVTTGKLREMETQGLIPGSYAFKALIYEMEKHAPDGAANMLHSLQGAFSNVKNFAEQTLGEMFKPLHDDLVVFLNGAQDSLGKFKEQVTAWSTDTKNRLASIFLGLGAMGPTFFALSGLARVFSLLLTPMGLVSVAVASLTAYLFTHREAVKGLTDYLEQHGNQIMTDFGQVMQAVASVGQALAPVLIDLAPVAVELFHVIAQVLGVFNQLPTPLKDAAILALAFNKPISAGFGFAGRFAGALGGLKTGALGFGDAITTVLPGLKGFVGFLSTPIAGGGLSGYLKSVVGNTGNWGLMGGAKGVLGAPVGGAGFASSLGGQLLGGGILAAPAMVGAWGLSAINSEHNATNDERSKQAGLFDPSPWLDKMAQLRQEMKAAGQGTEQYTTLLRKLHQTETTFRHVSGADARSSGGNALVEAMAKHIGEATGVQCGAAVTKALHESGMKGNASSLAKAAIANPNLQLQPDALGHLPPGTIVFFPGKGGPVGKDPTEHFGIMGGVAPSGRQDIMESTTAGGEGRHYRGDRTLSQIAAGHDGRYVAFAPDGTPRSAADILAHPPKFSPDDTKAQEQAAKAAASELAGLKQQAALYGNESRVADLEYRRKYGDLLKTDVATYQKLHAAAAVLDADDARKEARDKAQQSADEQKRAGQEALNRLLEKSNTLRESIAKLTAIPRTFRPGKTQEQGEYEGAKSEFAQTDLSALSASDRKTVEARQQSVLALARQVDAAKNWHDAVDAATQRNGELKKSLDLSASATQVQKDKYDLAHISLSALTSAFGKHGAAMAAALTVMLQTNIALDRQVSLHNALTPLQERAAAAALPRQTRETVAAAGGLSQWYDWGQDQQAKFSQQLGTTQAAEAQQQATDALESMARETALVGNAVTQAAQAAAGGYDNWNRLTGAYQTNLRKAVELKTSTDALYTWKHDGTADQITDLQSKLAGTYDPAKQAGIEWVRQNKEAIAQMTDLWGDAVTGLVVGWKQYQATQKYDLDQQVAGFQEMQKMQAEAGRKGMELSAADPFHAWLVSLYQLDAATGTLRLPPGMTEAGLHDVYNTQERAASAEKLQSLNDDLVRKGAEIAAADPFQKWLMSFETIEHHVDALGRVTTTLELPQGMDKGALSKIYSQQQNQAMIGEGITGLGNAAWAGLSAAIKPDTSSLVQLNQQMDALKIKRTQLESEVFVNKEMPNNPYVAQLKDINSQIDETQNKMHAMGNSLGSVLHRLFGTFYQDFAQTLQKMAMAYLQSQLMQMLSGALGGVFGGGSAKGSGLLGTITGISGAIIGGSGGGSSSSSAGGTNLFAGALGAAPSFGATALSTAGIMGHAQGGQVRAGMPFLGNEQGPEMFVPDRDGTVIPNDKLGDLAGDSNSYQFHFHFPPGTDVPAFRRAQSVVAAEAKAHVDRQWRKNR